MFAKKSNLELWTGDWSFLKTPLDTTWEEMQARKKDFQPVEIPHDWLIYDAKNLYEDSFGWYRKTFENTLSAGERMQVRFDGIYVDSTIYVNGKAVMDWKYGYTTFTADVTDFLKKGKNEIIVLARHRSPNSRWYSGAGIYRNVWLKTCKKTYLPMDGTYVVIRPCGEAREENHAFEMTVSTEVAGAVDDETRLEYRLIREDAEAEETADLGAAKIDADAGKAVFHTLIQDPALWDVDSPNCHRLQVKLWQGGEAVDVQEYTVGFRSIALTPEEGLFLNGRRVKVHGVCEHHDLGCLGAAFHETALRRQFQILKEMGVNGIRTSHNPPAPEFMELADRMGFLIDSEAFDMWERPKTTYDYARFFIDWAERDVESWIRRDRNHPSVFLWSIGNEIYDTHADDHGQEITRRLMRYVRAHDPEGNAAITIGSNYMPWEGAQKCADIVKMAGYNYGEKYYESHHKAHPDWIIYGSETASVVQSRGIYHFPLSQSILSDEDLQCSALGNSSTSWGAESTEKVITDHRDADFCFGQFIWTGFDYIGEPTPYHTKNSYFGQIDTAGFPKDPYYIFQAAWTDVKKKPMVHLFPHWDFNPGQMVDVRACTNAPQVELFVNGRRQGRQEIDHEKGKSLLGNWRVPYEPGVIMAIAYDENGKELAREERRSFGDSRQICLTPDKVALRADNQDLCFITIETLDEQGHPVENAVDYVTVEVEGPARILGMDNGDSTDEDSYKTNTRKLFSGKLLAVIGATAEPGVIKVKATGRGLRDAQVLLESHPAEAIVKSCLEDCAARKENGARKPDFVPTRKIELLAEGERIFTKKKKETEVTARVYPENATSTLIWKIVDATGIEVPTAAVEELPEAEGSIRRVKVTAKGDGAFLVRCMAKESSGKITVISELDFSAKGLGVAFLDPYGFIAGGLYSRSLGDIGNGNEKGFSTARDGMSAVLFENVDFGEYGSEEIMVPIFALNGEAYPMEIWEGMPGEKGSTLLDTVVYQKPSIWNTYQEETWKLPKRLKGVTSIAFLMRDRKIHVKGFSFKKTEKAFGLLYANEATRVYGDEFQKNGARVEGIGNNVTMEFENMDFGTDGASTLTICGWTPLAVNTIHVRLKPEDGGEVQARMVEFAGTGSATYNEQTFTFQKISGRGRLDLIFLPGCQFNLESIRFRKDEE